MLETAKTADEYVWVYYMSNCGGSSTGSCMVLCHLPVPMHPGISLRIFWSHKWELEEKETK